MRVVLAGGAEFALGTVETAVTIGMTDRSRRVTDDFGVTTVVERGFNRRLSARLTLPTADVDALQRRLAGLRATAATWIADDALAWLKVRGFYKSFELDLAVPPTSFCTLEVEGLAETEVAADAGTDPAPTGQASTLMMLRPTEIVDAGLLASSVAEVDAPAWVAGATYAVGARVIRAHRVFESLVAGNVGNAPESAPGSWLDIGPTNRWAMFDQALGTATTAEGEVIVRLSAGQVSAVALIDVIGATVRVTMPGYDRLLPVVGGSALFLDMPLRAGEVTIRLAGPGAVSVGTLLIGRLVGLGVTEASPAAGITDFSRKETDDFGETTVVERAWAKRMSVRSVIDSADVDAVANRLAGVRARPALWIGDTALDSLMVYGFWKEWSIEVAQGVSKLALSIEGLSTAAKIAPLTGDVAWPDVTDPLGTKPTDNADKTSENIAKDTAAVGGTPSAEVNNAIAQALAAAEALAATVDVQDDRITAARGLVDQATGDLLTLKGRVDAIVAGGDVGDLSARVETLEGADVQIEQAIAAVRQTVETGSNSNAALRASIIEQATALTTLDQSVADRITTLRAGYPGTLAQFDQRITGVASATGAVQERTTTLEARVDSLAAGGGEDARVPAIIARLDGTEFARTTALSAEAGRIDNALSRVGTTESRLNGTEFTRSTATDALANRTTNVEARAGGLESTVGIQAIAIADAADKLSAARLRLKTAAGPGTEAEIELASDQAGGGRIRFGGNSLFVGEVEVQSADTRGTTKFTGAAYEVRDANGQLRVRLGLY